MSNGQILVVPACEHGRGGGHLCRCISLVCDLRAQEREALLFLSVETEGTASLLKSMKFNRDWLITEEEIKNEKFEYIILDRFKTPGEELALWKKTAPVIGIDEGGMSRDSFDFLIDILIPEKLMSIPSNISSPALLKFPQLEEQNSPKLYEKDDKLKVLVTFGQEDKAGLGLATARALSNTDGVEITLIRGALSNSEEIGSLPNVQLLQNIPLLAEHFCEYDLVITHYGITAYEALYAGVPVLLASPTKHHEELAKTAGFLTIDLKIHHAKARRREGRKDNIKDGSSAIFAPWHLRVGSSLTNLKKHCEELAIRYKLREGGDLASLCASLSPHVNRLCPVCGADLCGKDKASKSLARFSERTYRRCDSCGVIYMDRSCPAPIEYEKEYFFESYKKQYGKTYLEDFENIKAAGKRRVKIIKTLLSPSSSLCAFASLRLCVRSFLIHPLHEPFPLLDIGCAYGPFLAAAREEGFSPSGIDPAQDAVNYVQNTLGIPAECGFFPHSPLPTPHSPPYDAITLWYVIEHFADCASVLAEIKKLLKPGGILAFSTPSFSGISGCASLKSFLSASPADHWTIWSPSMCKKALARFGFKVKKIKASGHHPERFPFFGKLAKSKKYPLYWPLLAISKIFKLGDTFEVYAKRED